MSIWPFKFEHYRALRRGEQPLLLAHLQRLSEKDLHDRFLAYVDGTDLLAHVNRDEPERETVGWFSKGVLRGAIEIFFDGDAAEAALSVEPRWRGQGIGTGLVARGLSLARDRGVQDLAILGSHGNYPLLAIAARFGAIEAAAKGHLVRGLPPIDDYQAMGLHFALQETSGAEQPGLLRRTFSPLWS